MVFSGPSSPMKIQTRKKTAIISKHTTIAPQLLVQEECHSGVNEKKICKKKKTTINNNISRAIKKKREYEKKYKE